jgi:hypothetical protein
MARAWQPPQTRQSARSRQPDAAPPAHSVTISELRAAEGRRKYKKRIDERNTAPSSETMAQRAAVPQRLTAAFDQRSNRCRRTRAQHGLLLLFSLGTNSNLSPPRCFPPAACCLCRPTRAARADAYSKQLVTQARNRPQSAPQFREPPVSISIPVSCWRVHAHKHSPEDLIKDAENISVVAWDAKHEEPAPLFTVRPKRAPPPEKRKGGASAKSRFGGQAMSRQFKVCLAGPPPLCRSACRSGGANRSIASGLL